MKTVRVKPHKRKAKTRELSYEEQRVSDDTRIWEKIKRDLPEPWEIPRVKQSELRRLYREFSRGIRDEELLAEVESKLIARVEVWQELNEAKVFAATPELEEDMRQTLDWYGMYWSWDTSGIYQAEDMMKAARGRRFNDRMIAVDQFINSVHEGGYLADMFIEGVDRENVQAFLDELSADKGEGRRASELRGAMENMR